MLDSVTINAEPIHLNISPYGFNHYAAEYLAVARSVEIGTSFSPVPYYLYCRCLELGLKAFLLLKGVPEQELKRKSLGHDLNAIVLRCEVLGLLSYLTLSSEEKGEISKANEYYATKDFEYVNVFKVVQGYPELPDLQVLDSIGAKIIDNLRDTCLNA